MNSLLGSGPEGQRVSLTITGPGPSYKDLSQIVMETMAKVTIVAPMMAMMETTMMSMMKAIKMTQ